MILIIRRDADEVQHLASEADCCALPSATGQCTATAMLSGCFASHSSALSCVGGGGRIFCRCSGGGGCCCCCCCGRDGRTNGRNSGQSRATAASHRSAVAVAVVAAAAAAVASASLLFLEIHVEKRRAVYVPALPAGKEP